MQTPSAHSPSAVRALLHRATAAVAAARSLLEGDERAQQDVREAYGVLHFAAARRIAEAVAEDTRLSADVDPDDAKGAALLAALHRVQNSQSAVERARE